MEEDTRAHIVVSGRVQGVLYRRAAQEKARELGVAGWARNAPDGSVELVAEGKKEKVQAFVAWCKQGTPLARVEQCVAQIEDYMAEFTDFTIREFGV